MNTDIVFQIVIGASQALLFFILYDIKSEIKDLRKSLEEHIVGHAAGVFSLSAKKPLC